MGNYDCPECDFVTTNFNHYKMHRLYNHKPKTAKSVERKLQKLSAIGIDLPSDDDLEKFKENRYNGESLDEYKERIKSKIPKEPDYDDPSSQGKRFKNIQNFLRNNPQSGYGTDKHIEIPEKQINDYVYEGIKTRPVKPKQKDYRNIISANLKELKHNIIEARIAIEHKHQIVWRGAKMRDATNGKPTTRVGKWAKIWLLNARQVNGNNWGVSPETIEHNIQYFVNRPYVITAKEWVPETVYDTYDHPYVPTNDLYKVLQHQETYRVGTIRKVNREGDDYYAIIEVNPKFANRTLPSFCSPAIFQVDPFEPENNIKKWIPLHLAGLDQSPAYGARIALLRGTCLGTAEQCIVQLKTAKLYETGIVCPVSVGTKLSALVREPRKRGVEPTTRYNPDTPLFNEVPFGPEIATKEKQNSEFDNRIDVEKKRGVNEKGIITNPKYKVRPPTPTDQDYERIITAKSEIEIGQKIEMEHTDDPEEARKIAETHLKENPQYYKEVSGLKKEILLVPKAKLEDEEPIPLEKIIEWWDTNNVSKRQHAIDPNRHDNEKSLEMSGKPWNQLDDDEHKSICIAYSFRHQDAYLCDLLPVDPRENSENWWNLYTPSMREHMLDPHQLLGLTEMVKKNYDALTDVEKSQVDKQFEDRHEETSKNPTKSGKEHIDAERLGRLLVKIANVSDGLHPNADVVEEELRKKTENPNNPLPSQMSMFMSRNGEFLGGGEEHEYTARRLSHHVGVNFHRPEEDTYEDMHNFLKNTGMIRVQSFPRKQKYNFHIVHTINQNQLKSIKDIEKSDPNADIGFSVEPKYGEVYNGMGTNELMRHLRQHKMIKSSKQEVKYKLALLKKSTKTGRKLQKLAELNNFGKQEAPNVKINPEHGKIIADAYGDMKHDPNNPEVKKAYGALISETGKQYKDLLDKGLKIDSIKGENPYPNSKSMHEDIEKNNHLHYYPTEKGFGSGEDNKDHPMLQETEFKHEGKPMLANDVFRIVHDINGHHKIGSGFGPRGEHQAYLTHKKMYSDTAHKALFTETAAQNNYVNFGPNGEHNRKNPEKTIYAPQKAGIMPDKILRGVFHNG